MRQMRLNTEAFEHRCLYTQKHLHRDALTYYIYIRLYLYTQKLLHTYFFRQSQKLWHREAFAQRIFYTEKLWCTGAFTHRRLYTHRSLYTRRLLHTEAFTQRSLYTQTVSHRETISTEQLSHASKSYFYLSFWRSAIISCETVASGVGKSQLLTLGNRFAWKGCAWPCNVFFRAKRLCLTFQVDKIASLHQFLNVCIWR